MSGTSLDAADAIVASFSQTKIQCLEHQQTPIAPDLQQTILTLCKPGPNEIEKLASADNQLAELYTLTITNLLKKAKLKPTDIRAIGLHGQTIRHLPELGNTIQIGNPNLVALKTQIPTVFDVRRKNMASGGQGAPLAPAFHQTLFHTPKSDRIIVNIGGIANISCIPKNGSGHYGFDTGPGNLLMNEWIHQHLQQQYDDQGQWAASGNVIPELLKRFLEHPYFEVLPPKSTGRESFNLKWLEKTIKETNQLYTPQNIQCTLAHLTAETISRGIQQTNITDGELIVCGGGAKNKFVMSLLAEKLAPNFCVNPSDKLGINSQHIEALMMAWLAKLRIEETPVDLKSTTGSFRNTVLGSLYTPQ